MEAWPVWLQVIVVGLIMAGIFGPIFIGIIIAANNLGEMRARNKYRD